MHILKSRDQWIYLVDNFSQVTGKKNVNRKYHNDCLKIGFYLADDLFVHSLQHFLCWETLSNSGMKPSMLLSHFQAKYSGLSSKPVESSQIKYKIMCSRVKLINFFHQGPRIEQNLRDIQDAFVIAKADLLRSLQHQPQSWWQTHSQGKSNKLYKIPLSNAALACHIINQWYAVWKHNCVCGWILYHLLKSLICRVWVSP